MEPEKQTRQEERKKREGSDWKEKTSWTDVEGRRDGQQMEMEETKISHSRETKQQETKRRGTYKLICSNLWSTKVVKDIHTRPLVSYHPSDSATP